MQVSDTEQSGGKGELPAANEGFSIIPSCPNALKILMPVTSPRIPILAILGTQ